MKSQQKGPDYWGGRVGRTLSGPQACFPHIQVVAYHHLILLQQQEILNVLYKMLRAPLVAIQEKKEKEKNMKAQI